MADPVSFAITQVATLGINYLFPSEGPRIKDMKMSASTYGAGIPNTWGTCRVAGNVIWADKVKEHKKKVKTGKGGFSNQYTYSCSFAAGFSAGPISQFLRIWADGKLIYDATGASPVQNQSKYIFRFYTGTETQVPDSLIESLVGDGNTPAFRGLAYVVFDNFPLTDFSNRIPQLTAEVATTGTGSVGFSVFAIADGSHYLGSVTVGSIGENEREYYWITGGYADGTHTEFLELHGPQGTLQIPNPENPVSPQLGFAINAAIWDEFDPGILLFYSTDNFHWAAKWSRASNTIKWTKAVPTYFGGRGNLKYGSYAAILPQGGDGPEGHYYLSVWMLDTATGLWKYRDGWPDPNEATYAGMPVTSSAIEWSYEGQYFDSWNNCIVSAGTSSTSPHITYLPKGTEYLDPIRLRHADGSSFGTYQLGRMWVDFNRGHVFIIAIDGTGARYLKRVRMSDGLIDRTISGGPMGGFYSIFEIMPGNGDLVISNALANSVPISRVDGLSYKKTFTSGTASNFGYEWPPPFDSPGISAISTDTNGNTSIIYRELFGQVLVIDLNPAGSLTTLEDIVYSLLIKGGLTDDQLSLTQLRNTIVTGYGFARGTDVKEVIDELRRVYLFDLVESQGKLVAVMRGGNEAFDNGLAKYEIPQNVLGSSSPDALDFWQATRSQDADIPGQVELGYLNYSNDYNAGVARSQRVANPIPTMYSRQKLSMELNLIMTPDKAKIQARKMLYAQWTERTQHSTRLPWAYMDMDPADVISVTMNDGRNFQDRVHAQEIGADGTIVIETYSQDNGAYLQTVEADGGSGGYPSDLVYEPEALKSFVINTPLLRDNDDTGGSYSLYYGGMARTSIGTRTFQGGSMWRSLNDIDFDFIIGSESELHWGYVQAALPSPSHGAFALDWENTITVHPQSQGFELSSISDDDLWAGANAAYLGNEIIQFRDAVQNLDGTWTLSNLLRGRRGTEYACDNHGTLEEFVLLEASPLSLAGETLDSRGGVRYYLSVEQGGTLDTTSTTEKTITYEPRDLMPYAPSDIRRDITSAGTVHVTWKRRTRMGGSLMDFTGTVPLNEGAEQYEVYFLSAPFSGDLSRGNAPSEDILKVFVTTDPEIEWDPTGSGFDPFLDDLHVVVYQVSSAVGRGFPGVRDIAPWDDF